jgi:hypothetical protein
MSGSTPQPHRALRIVSAATLAEGVPAEALIVLATTPSLPAVDVLGAGDGWLARLAGLAAAPLTLDLFFAGRRGPDWHEVDAFALATVYGQVIWDDRMWGWHAECGRDDSAARIREIHDLALRCHRQLDAGERLVLVSVPPA